MAKMKPGLYVVQDGEKEKLIPVVEGSVRAVQADGETISFWMTFEKDAVQVSAPCRIGIDTWGQGSVTIRSKTMP